MDGFVEFLILKKKNFFDYCLILISVFAAICGTIAIFPFLMLQIYGMFACLAIIFIWFLAYTIIMSRHIEYEYCITGNVMDIDIITAKKKRKSFYSLNLENCEIIAPASIDYLKQFENGKIQIKLDASKRDPKVMDYFLICHGNDGKTTRVLFTPNEEILKFIKKVNPRKFFEE